MLSWRGNSKAWLMMIAINTLSFVRKKTEERFYVDLPKTRTQYDGQFSQNTLADINI